MDTLSLRIAIIGAGNMGGAIARGLIAGNMIANSNIRVSDVGEQSLQRLKVIAPEITVSTSNTQIVVGADIIIIAVKPWFVQQIADEISNTINYKQQMIVSVAAGVDFEALVTMFQTEAAMFRLIPNTAIDVFQSVNTIAAYNTTSDQNQLIEEVFSALGRVFVVPESQMNAFMSLSSCGIAYAFRYVRASMEGGVELGIAPQMAKEIVLQTLKGAVALLEANNSHPEAEIDKVTTPGGITIKGLNEMEAYGFSNAIIKGLKASHIK